MGKKPAFVRCLSAAVSGQQRPMVPRLAAMIRAFHIERAYSEPVTPVAIVTTQPDHPPLFRLAPGALRLRAGCHSW